MQPDKVDSLKAIEVLKEKLSEVEYSNIVNQIIISQYHDLLTYLAQKYPEIRKELKENGNSQSGREQETRTNNSNTAETNR